MQIPLDRLDLLLPFILNNRTLVKTEFHATTMLFGRRRYDRGGNDIAAAVRARLEADPSYARLGRVLMYLLNARQVRCTQYIRARLAL